MNTKQRFNDVVGLMYEAAVNPDLLRPALLGCAEMSGVPFFHTFAWDHRINRPLFGVVSHDFLNEPLRQYDEYFHTVDPLLENLLQQQSGQLIVAHHLFDDQFVKRSEYYQDLLAQHELGWIAAGMVQVKSHVSVALALIRAQGNGPMTESDLM